MYLGEAKPVTGDSYHLDGDDSGSNSEMLTVDYHNQGQCNAFSDGHCEYIKLAQIPAYSTRTSSQYWSATYTGSNP
jgi:hypothetical protein